jgi:hypothetical protein
MIDYFFNEWMADVAQTASGVQGASVGIGLGVLVAGTGTAAAIPIAIFSAGIAALLAAQSQGLQGLKTQATTAKRAALRQALYAATNASAASTAWNSTIDGFSDVHIGYRTAWKTLIWSNWFNDLYDAAAQNSTTVPGKWDLDGYDGSICSVGSFPASGSIRSSAVFITGYANRQCIVWPNGVEFTDWVGYHYNGNVGNPINPSGLRFTISDTSSGQIRFVPLFDGSADHELRNQGNGSTYAPGATWGVNGFYIDTFDDNTAFTVSWITL